FADRERRARAAAVHPDHHAFEHLDALLVPFAHLHVHAHSIARLDRRALGQLSALDGLNGCHDKSPSIIGGDPCTPPGSLLSARAPPLAPFRSLMSGADPDTPPGLLLSARAPPLAHVRSGPWPAGLTLSANRA